MREKKIVTLDLTNCQNLEELHQRIKNAFDFPEWYGENWDAFYDLLSGNSDLNGISIIGEYTLSKEFDSQIKILHKILQEIRESHAKYQHNFIIETIN